MSVIGYITFSGSSSINIQNGLSYPFILQFDAYLRQKILLSELFLFICIIFYFYSCKYD